MDIVFRKIRGCVVAPPEAGEIVLLPSASAQGQRWEFANLALTGGAAAFLVGPGPTQRIVVDADPTLDDLLAATFVIRHLKSEPLPAGLEPFARYAALVREGLKPTEIALENSLEGIFLALRSTAGGSLTDAAIGARFVKEWQRMADRIIKAADAGVNPFTTALFESEPEFARERAFLRQDHEVFKQDVRRGERWDIAIPGGPPQASALLLRQPKSLLFKYWSRRGDGADASLLLAITTAPGQWVFSTDPIQRLSLKPLVELLQSAEAAQDAKRATTHPWFDGEPFGHTLIAAPRGGTVLPEQKLLGIVKSWCRVRSSGRPRLARGAGILASAAAVLLLAIGLVWHFNSRPEQPAPRGLDIPPGPSPNNGPSVKGNLHLLTVGVSQYKDSKFNLKLARGDAEKLADVVQKHSSALFDKVDATVLTDEKATRQEIIKKLALLKRKANQHDFVMVTLAGHGAHLDENNDFYFLPHDYDEANKDSSGVFWDDLKRSLGNLPCRVLLVLDTCHSGTVTRQLRGERKTALESGVNQMMQKSGVGMVVMAACLGSGTAQEKNEWGHGALTLALVEGLSGTHLYRAKTQTVPPVGKGDDRVINLHDLNVYVTNRVQELAGDHQAVVTNQTGDIALTKILVSSAKTK